LVSLAGLPWITTLRMSGCGVSGYMQITITFQQGIANYSVFDVSVSLRSNDHWNLGRFYAENYRWN